jgi:cytochrome P450
MTAVSGLRHYPFEPFTGDLPEELLEMVVSKSVSRVLLTDGRPAWLVLGYADCCTVLADPRFSRVHIGRPDAARGGGPRDMNMDGRAHADVRRVASRAFTARRIETYRPLVQRLVDQLIDAMLAGPCPGDLVSALVAPLPVRVICEVLGVPVSDRQRFYGWIEDLNSIVAYGSAAAEKARSQLAAYLAGQLAAKRASPGDDLLSAWTAARDSRELTDPELVELAIGVLLGGLEINSISAGLRALFQHPDQLKKLLSAPEKLPAATEEILRYTAVSSMSRVQAVATDTELGGVAMRAGEYIMALPAAGNRDPRVFAEPNVFDIDRLATAPHLGFGYGPHFCLGSALGKLQVEVSIGTLLRRLPGLAPAVPLGQIPWRHDRLNCGIASFPVAWQAARGRRADGTGQ